MSVPGCITETNSGESAMPVSRKRCRRPCRTATRWSPGRSPHARAKASWRSTSSERPGSGMRPSRRYTSLSSERPCGGRETACAATGSAMPGMSRVTSSARRASAMATPGSEAMRPSTERGARRTDENTSGKRARAYQRSRSPRSES
ncbi:MAG: hypothetical protein IPF99_17310 [Deltaproteobacteria bacterium]|nr:hypothetical protein [Deltaproteobacteria bacterium]